MIELSKKLGEMEYDGLLAGLTPPVQTGKVTLRKLGTAGTLKRGTLLGISSSDSKCVILGTTAGGGETITPCAVLCDDTDVGTADDVVAIAYTAGLFNANRIDVKSGYTITAADLDTLRKYDIILKAAQAAQ